jgi:poly(3-hydroxybutyrate) depolymerase
VNSDRLVADGVRAVGPGAASSAETGGTPGGHGYTRTIYENANGETVVEQWSVHQAGHAWSGGSPQGSYTDPQGPDASAEIIRFFLEHPGPPR